MTATTTRTIKYLTVADLHKGNDSQWRKVGNKLTTITALRQTLDPNLCYPILHNFYHDRRDGSGVRVVVGRQDGSTFALDLPTPIYLALGETTIPTDGADDTASLALVPPAESSLAATSIAKLDQIIARATHVQAYLRNPTVAGLREATLVNEGLLIHANDIAAALVQLERDLAARATSGGAS